MRCLVVDDEPIARSILENYISKTPALELIGSIDNAIDVLNYLKEGRVDLIFLDINMPELSGIELLKALRNPPKVIITTAYSAYGAESYEYDVVDYLVKPIPFERFLKAVQKLMVEENSRVSFLFIKGEKQTHKVITEDIIYISAYGNYLKVHLEDQVIITRKTIAEMEADCQDFLIRVHKSFLLPLSSIKKIQGNMIILINGKEIPIGKTYKAGLEKLTKY